MSHVDRILPTRMVLEGFLLAAVVAGVFEAGLAMAGKSLDASASSAVTLASIALFAAMALPIAVATYGVLGIASRIPGLGFLGGAPFRGGFAAVIGVLPIPLMLEVNTRRPGFSLTTYHVAPYLGVLLGVLVLAGLVGALVAVLARRGSSGLGVRHAAWRIGILAVVVASALAVWPRFGSEMQTSDAGSGVSDRPNLVLISIDTLRADHLGIYGYSKPTDPEIQRHFADGLIFRDAVAPVPLTRPAHTAMLTGMHPAELGVYSNYHVMSEDVTTLAEILDAEGYRTGGFVSGWPLFGETSQLDRGFDHYSDRFSPLMRIHPAIADLSLPIVLQKLRLVDSVQRNAEDTMKDALAWLGEVRAEPFFAFVHLYDPHVYYEAPRDFQIAMGVAEEETRNHRWVTSLVASDAKAVTSEVQDFALSLYDAEIRFADSQVGRLLDRIDELGLRDDTIVVLTADHGETLFERLAGEGVAFAHGLTLEEHDIRVPYLMRGPGVPSGDSPLTATHDDIAPTLLALAQLEAPDEMTGGNLLAGETGHPALSFNYDQGEVERVTVREDGWKYTRFLVSGKERLEAIEGVTSTTSAAPAGRPELVGRLQSYVRAMPIPGEKAVVDPLEADRLRALGYIQ